MKVYCLLCKAIDLASWWERTANEEGKFSFFTRSTTAISKLKMTMKDSFQFCFYAQTISIVLVTANEAGGSLIPSLFMSLIGIFITIAVIMSAIKPHLPDIDEFLDGLN